MSDLSVRGLALAREGFRLGPLDLDIAAGEAVALIGPSGAGKTTLLRALAGFAPLRGGEVAVGGRPVGREPPEVRRMGYVPQGLALFPHRSVRGNVAYPLELRRAADAAERTERLLAAWGLAELAGANALKVSGGEQQRTAMARALAAEPEVLLWDEPLSAVDASARADLVEAVRTVLRTERLALLLVTHDAETAFSVADRLVLLEGGRPVAITGPRSLVERPPTRFAADFVGYDNVLAPAELAGGAPGSFAAWLRGRAGDQGVAFLATDLRADAPGGAWIGRVTRRRSTPGGTQLWLDVDGIELRLAAPAPSSDAEGARAGDRVAFDLPETSLRPLGSHPEAAG